MEQFWRASERICHATSPSFGGLFGGLFWWAFLAGFFGGLFLAGCFGGFNFVVSRVI
jgi:hypothetical protein